DLVRYYEAVREPLLAAMGGRPLLLQRFPDGAAGKSFFQKRVAPTRAAPWITTTVVSTPNGTRSDALVAVDLAHVLWAVNMGCLGFHVWPSTAADPGHADELRLDLDPSPGCSFPMIQEAASEVKALLDEVGVAGHPKTTGNRGIHVYVRLQPRWDGYQVRAAARRGAGRPVGKDVRRAAVAGAAARDARAGHGRRPSGRALASRLPEDAQRAAPRRAEPGAEDRRLSVPGADRRTPVNGSTNLVSRRVCGTFPWVPSQGLPDCTPGKEDVMGIGLGLLL